MMATHQGVARPERFVRSFAGPSTNTTPTSSSTRIEKPRMNCFRPAPSSRPTTSGTLMPALRTESMPEK